MEYINEQYDPAMNWKDAEYCIKRWGGPFAIKGVMSVEDAKRAVDIGASAIMLSNHGGRQLDGSRSPFDQLKTIVDAVGGKIRNYSRWRNKKRDPCFKALIVRRDCLQFWKRFSFCFRSRWSKRC